MKQKHSRSIKPPKAIVTATEEKPKFSPAAFTPGTILKDHGKGKEFQEVFLFLSYENMQELNSGAWVTFESDIPSNASVVQQLQSRLKMQGLEQVLNLDKLGHIPPGMIVRVVAPAPLPPFPESDPKRSFWKRFLLWLK